MKLPMMKGDADRSAASLGTFKKIKGWILLN